MFVASGYLETLDTDPILAWAIRLQAYLCALALAELHLSSGILILDRPFLVPPSPFLSWPAVAPVVRARGRHRGIGKGQLPGTRDWSWQSRSPVRRSTLTSKKFSRSQSTLTDCVSALWGYMKEEEEEIPHKGNLHTSGETITLSLIKWQWRGGSRDLTPKWEQHSS